MKKLLSVLLAIILAAGMSAVAFAAPASSSKITGFKGTWSGEQSNLGELSPQKNKKEIVLAYFSPADFEWSGTAKSSLALSDLSSGKIKLRYVIRSGKKAISSVRIGLDKNKSNTQSYNKPAILLTLASPFMSLSEIDFEIDVYVYGQGQGSQTQYGINATGTMKNFVEEIEKGDTYLDMSEGHIAQFNATCRNFEFQLSDNMSIWGTGLAKKKYWAYADYEPTEQDMAIMVKNKSITDSITLSTLTFNPDLVTVKFHDLSASIGYVYTVDSSGKLLLLGKANTALPVVSKYYLSTKEISGVKKYTPLKSSSTK